MMGASDNFELEMLLHVRHTGNNATNKMIINPNGNSIVEPDSNNLHSGQFQSLTVHTHFDFANIEMNYCNVHQSRRRFSCTEGRTR